MINVKDNIGAINQAQLQQLTDKAHAYSFDIQVVVGATGSKSAFQSEVSSYVTHPGMISIGIDPAHKFTFVRTSKDLGIPDNPDLAKAGNASFRSGDLVGGIDSIAAKAKSMAVTSRIVESSAGAPIVVQEQPMATGWWWALGGIGIVVLAVGTWVWLRNRAAEKRAEDEARRYRALNAELNDKVGDKRLRDAERDFDRRLSSSPRYSAPAAAPSPVIVQQSNNNDLLTGVLIGDMMNSHHHHRETIVREAAYPSPTPSTWDSGSSSSSSWSDSSSSDSGGSSSSDWGSSSDSGGGGDWGGGSSGGSWD